jgi:hypothetical protein
MTTITTTRKISLANPSRVLQNNGPNNNGSFFCKHCGCNRTHDTSKCYFLKDKTQRFKGKTSDSNKEAGQKERPFSPRTFRKEVNTLARKASKKGALGVYASALKRQQDKESKAKMAKRRVEEMEDSISVNNVEKLVPRSLAKPIPCKIVKRTLVAKVSLAKDSKKKAAIRVLKRKMLSRR